jgi:hypothetical protein
LEQRAWSRGSGWSWSGTQVSNLLFFLSFILFVYLWNCSTAPQDTMHFAVQLHKICCATAQHSEEGNVAERKKAMVATWLSPSSSSSLCCKKKSVSVSDLHLHCFALCVTLLL